MTQPLLAAPITKMDLMALQEALGQTVMHQLDAVHELGSIVMQAWQHHRDAGRPMDRPFILKALLAGPSGCGKTESVNWLRWVLGMNKGFVHQAHIVYVDASECSNSTSATRLTGSSAGYTGYGDATLPDQLRAALVSDEMRDMLAMPRNRGSARDYNARLAECKRKDKDGTLNPPPPVLLLFIDEVDKAHPDFIGALNGLLDTGRMATPSGAVFDLPRETCLLCLFTSNFGDVAISQLEAQDAVQAQRCVEEAVAARGLPKCTLERFGKIVVYFALERDQLAAVLHAKLDAYIARGNRISRQYGALRYDDSVKLYLVDHVLAQADRERGVRNGVRLLFENLDKLFEQALCVIERHIASDSGDMIEGEDFHVFMHSFKLSDTGRELSGVLERIMESAMNRKQLALYKTTRRDDELVSALGVRQRETVFAINVMPLVSAFVAFAQDTTQRIEKLEKGKAKLQDRNGRLRRGKAELKETLGEVFMMTERVSDVAEMRKQVREIQARKQPLMEASDTETSTSETEEEDDRRRKSRCMRDTTIRARQAGQLALRGRVTEVDDSEEDEPSSASNNGKRGREESPPPTDELVVCLTCRESKPEGAFDFDRRQLRSGEWAITRRNACRQCRYKLRKVRASGD